MDITTEKMNVTAVKAKQFYKRGIHTVEDLLLYLPRKYNDYTALTGPLPDLDIVSVFFVDVTSIKEASPTMIVAKGTIVENGAPIAIRWFHCNYQYFKLKVYEGKRVVCAGKLKTTPEKFGGGYSVMQPGDFGYAAYVMQIRPVYRKITGMADTYLQDRIKTALSMTDLLSDPVPEDIQKRADVIPFETAIRQLHTPGTGRDVEQGKKRILLDDLLYYAIRNEWVARNAPSRSNYILTDRTLLTKVEASLPFALTEDQRKAVYDMATIASRPVLGRDNNRINGLLCGDVGTGKTAVAMLICAAFIGNGYQAALMAPTQVLARQHYLDFKARLEPHGIHVAYLDSDLKGKDKRTVLENIRKGSAQMIIGTHSCIAKDVDYKNLAIAIVDEEHKFGVRQRTTMIEKAKEGVHSLTMSATPIPRTLAQTIYGDSLQLYTIRTKPAGRKEVKTASTHNMNAVLKFLKQQVDAGHQAYIVCPMIGTSETDVEDEEKEETLHIYSVQEMAEICRSSFGDTVNCETLTGKDTTEDTARKIQEYKEGKTDILISTTVIEVGVNVPNATGMVILNAERFGMAGLHQLRGRVGRSDLQSYCVLFSETKDEDGVSRLKTLCSTNDGFEIATADLKQRGSGDLLGTQQSGINKYIELALLNQDMYKEAQEYARVLLDRGDTCRIVQEAISDDKQIAC